MTSTARQPFTTTRPRAGRPFLALAALAAAGLLTAAPGCNWAAQAEEERLKAVAAAEAARQEHERLKHERLADGLKRVELEQKLQAAEVDLKIANQARATLERRVADLEQQVLELTVELKTLDPGRGRRTVDTTPRPHPDGTGGDDPDGTIRIELDPLGGALKAIGVK